MFKDCGCGCKGKRQEGKFYLSLVCGLLFFIFASPTVYKLTRSIFGTWVSSQTGCASSTGLLLHAVVFALVSFGLMQINREYMEGSPAPDPESDPAPAPASNGQRTKKPVPKPMKKNSKLLNLHEPKMDMIMPQLTGMSITEENDLVPNTYISCNCSDGKKVLVMN